MLTMQKERFDHVKVLSFWMRPGDIIQTMHRLHRVEDTKICIVRRIPALQMTFKIFLRNKWIIVTWEEDNPRCIMVWRMVDQFIIKYNLNEYQDKVVHLMEKWFTNFNNSNPGLLPSKPEICQIIFLMSTFKDGQEMRILISVATNVAMDTVLPGLLELRFNDFISIKRIARNIFPYSLWTRSDVNGVEYATLREMHDQMMEESIDERLEIEEELKSLWEAKIAKHKRNSKM